jgi:dipeptidase E
LRLYLSSYRLGNRPQRLMELVAPAAPAGAAKAAAVPKALVIANACDLLDQGERRLRVEREIVALEELGFSAEELDLRGYFPDVGFWGDKPIGLSIDKPIDKPIEKAKEMTALQAALDSAALVWARGGNAFVLLRAMRQSGFADALIAALAADSVVYGGYSGGIAVLPQTLRGLETVNDPAAVPPGYDPVVPWEGLGILPYSLAPHYKSAHAASPGIDGVVRYFQAHRMPFKTLRDGEVRILSGRREELVS